LHDGVCQQLAGIAFLTSTLAEELAEQDVTLSPQVEEIGATLNLQSQPGLGTTATCLFLPVSRELCVGFPRRQRIRRRGLGLRAV
jgi:hypothetical protein